MKRGVLPDGAKLVQKGKLKYKFDLTIDSDEQIEKDMRSFRRELQKMGKHEVINYAVCCLGNWNYSMNDRNRALKKVQRLEKRHANALRSIPVGDDTDDSGEALHNYSRVSEKTIQNVERALGRRR